MKANIALIGMAGVGKSRHSTLLAAELGWDAIEIDELVSDEAAKEGLDKNAVTDQEFMRLEEQAVLSLAGRRRCVFDTGGSVIYSEPAMDFLKKHARIIYLRDAPERIEARFRKRPPVRVIGLPGKDFHALLAERSVLYEKYADEILDVSDLIE